MRYLTPIIQRHWALLAVVLLAIVTAGSLRPGQEPLPEILPWDKAQHFLAYAAIALPIAVARPRHWSWMLLGLAGWSLAIEFIQPSVGRDRDIRDFLANSMGVALAALISQALRRATLVLRRG